MNYTLHMGDCLEYLRTLPTGSVDAVITDPPYGLIASHASWDVAPDWDVFHAEVKRVSRMFYAVFCMMPMMIDVANSCSQHGFKLSEHVIWVKRNAMPGGNAYKLKRGHESILVYGIHGTPRLNTIKGPFEDVKIPGIMFDLVTIDTLQRHYSDLRLQAKRGFGSIRHGHGNASDAHMRFKTGKDSDAIATNGDVNFTNVWSFMPPGLKKRTGNPLHPTQKPVDVVQRLIEMTTENAATVLDPFMGSGTTGVACMQTGRNFIGCEIDPGYFAIAKKRIEDAAAQPPLIPHESEPKHEQAGLYEEER